MDYNKKCTSCGAAISTGAPDGFCEACLLKLALGPVEEKSGQKVGPHSTVVVSFPLTEKAGDRIGRYKLLEQIGEGGCGVVYLADQHEPIRRRVALKVIKPGMDSKHVLARFEAERQALALMDHPNIAKVFDAGATEKGRPYFVMELVKGIPITRYCDENHLNTNARLGLFALVCQAIQHAHQKGIIHRDIKPSNVLISDHDGKPVPKIIDFGIAKATNGQTLTNNTLFTSLDQFIGTPAYMSPEQARLSGLDIDTRSDIYSLGVLLYELLTGRTPFEKKRLFEAGFDEIRRIIREEEPQRPSARISTLDAGEQTTVARQRQSEPAKLMGILRGDLDWIVMKTLEKDRSRRYETANGLAADINRYLNNELVAARPPSSLYRFQKLVHRNKLAFAAISAVMASLVIGLVTSTWALFKEQKANREAIAQAGRAQRSEVAEKAQRQRAEKLLEETKVQMAEDLFKAGNPPHALAVLADILRKNTGNHVAINRLISALSYKTFAIPITQQLSHENYVKHSRFSPDGKLVLTASTDKTACVWDAQTGQRQSGPLVHQAALVNAEFSPDGLRVLSVSKEPVARIWDTKTGALLLTLAHGSNVSQAHFSPRGDLVVTGGWDGTAKVWDSATGQRLSEVDIPKSQKGIKEVIFSPEGDSIATAGWAGNARVWNARTGKPRTPLMWASGTNFSVFSIDFSPDGTHLLTGSDNYRVELWDARTGMRVYSRFHNNWVNSVHFSPDGQKFITGSYDGTAQVWETKTGKTLGKPLKHDGVVYSAQFSPDGRYIVTASEDKTARIWDAETGELMMEPLKHGSEVYYAEFSGDGRRVTTASKDNTAMIWDVSFGNASSEKLEHDEKIWFARYTPDGSKVISGQNNFLAWVWDARTGIALQRDLRLESSPSTSMVSPGAQQTVDCSPDGRKIVSVDYSGCAAIWDVDTGQQSGPKLSHKQRINQVMFDSDGTKILTASLDNTARVWDSRTGAPLTPPLVSDDYVFSIDMSADGQKIITGSKDGTWSLWNAQGQLLMTNRQHLTRIVFVKFSPDEKTFVTASWDTTVRVWDTDSGKMRFSPLRHNSVVERAEFSADSQRIVTCSWDGTARVWDAITGKPVTPAMQHAAALYFAQFNHDGTQVVTASADQTARVWDSKTGQPLTEPLQHDGAVYTAQFSPDDQRVVTASQDKTVRIWEIPFITNAAPSWLPELAEAVVGQRVNGDGLLEPVPVERILEIKQQIEKMPPDDYYQRWGKWFFADRSTRSLSPLSPLTVTDLVQREINSTNLLALEEAVRLSPTNVLALARLAKQLAANDLKSGTNVSWRADWYSRRALSLDSNNDEALKIRSVILSQSR